MLLCCAAFVGDAQQRSYAGFDRNDYPGDAALAALRKSFRYAGYWLNAPPGETQNSWTGKRGLLKESGFGFLVLFNGRRDRELEGADAAALGTADGKAAVVAAAREGFPERVILFLDQEEGGRLLPEQAAYFFAWADAVRAGGARAGVYCSGIDVPEGSATISTARDIVERESARARNSSRQERGALEVVDRERSMSAFAGMHAANAGIERGCLRGACRRGGGVAVCAVAAACAVQRGMPGEPGVGWELLRAGDDAEPGYVCGFEHGEFGRSVGGTDKAIKRAGGAGDRRW